MLFDSRIVQSFLWLGGPSGKESALRMQEIQEMRVQSLDREDPMEEGMVKTLPVTQETCIGSLGREDLLEKEIATCSSILV